MDSRTRSWQIANGLHSNQISRPAMEQLAALSTNAEHEGAVVLKELSFAIGRGR